MKFIRRRFRLPALLILLALLLGGVAWQKHTFFTSWFYERPFRTALPSARPVLVVSPTAAPSSSAVFVSSVATPLVKFSGDVNLNVPFASQAPFRNWAQPYQDACEEAAIIMIERSLRGASLSREEMDKEILRMVDFQKEHLGSYKDTNAAETAQLAEAFYPTLHAEVRYDVTAEDLKNLLHEGHPILLLVNGRKLGNPFYTPPGPDKHAIVIKGVKGDRFITHDPGIGRGKDFVYPIATVMAAAVDYDGLTPGTGKRALVLLSERQP